MSRTRSLWSFWRSGAPRPKVTEQPQTSGGQKTPAVSHGETLLFFCSGGSRQTPEGREQKSREVALQERTPCFPKATAELPSDPHRTGVPGKTRQRICAAHACARQSSTPPLPLRCLLLDRGLCARTCGQGRVRTNPTPARAPAPSGGGALRRLRSFSPPGRGLGVLGLACSGT